VLSGSRKGVIGILVIVLIEYFLFIFSKRDKGSAKRLVVSSIVAFLFFSMFSYVVLKSEFGYRSRNIGRFLKGERQERGERSLNLRLHLYKVGLNRFAKHPVIGTGLRTFEKIDMKSFFISKKVGAYSHSNFIEILVSSGLIGLLCYYSMYLFSLWEAYQNLNYSSDDRLRPLICFVVSAIMLLFFYDLFSVTYYDKSCWIFLSLIFGCTKMFNNARIF
jgi:O-antigen ligase